jgi:hypothetical protein
MLVCFKNVSGLSSYAFFSLRRLWVERITNSCSTTLRTPRSRNMDVWKLEAVTLAYNPSYWRLKWYHYLFFALKCPETKIQKFLVEKSGSLFVLMSLVGSRHQSSFKIWTMNQKLSKFELPLLPLPTICWLINMHFQQLVSVDTSINKNLIFIHQQNIPRAIQWYAKTLSSNIDTIVELTSHIFLILFTEPWNPSCQMHRYTLNWLWQCHLWPWTPQYNCVDTSLSCTRSHIRIRLGPTMWCLVDWVSNKT